MSGHRSIPAIPFHPARDTKDDGRVPGKVRRFSNVANWLSHPDVKVSRAELWEMLNRYEAGRVALEAHNFEVACDQVLAHWRAQAWYRRFWRWVRRQPPPPRPTLPKVPLEGL